VFIWQAVVFNSLLSVTYYYYYSYCYNCYCCMCRRGLSKADRHSAGKRLCSAVCYLLAERRDLCLDVLIQCEHLDTTDAAVIHAFAR